MITDLLIHHNQSVSHTRVDNNETAVFVLSFHPISRRNNTLSIHHVHSSRFGSKFATAANNRKNGTNERTKIVSFVTMFFVRGANVLLNNKKTESRDELRLCLVCPSACNKDRVSHCLYYIYLLFSLSLSSFPNRHACSQHPTRTIQT